MTNAIAFLLITIFIDAVGIGILIPVIPELIQELTSASISQAAVYGGAITALFATMQFLFSPVLGNLSDSYGRRPVLLLSLTAFGLNYILMGLAPTIVWLFVAQAFAGIFGATPSTASAYIADVTEPRQRAKRYGAMGAAFGLGFMVGPVLSGLVAGWGIRMPFFVAAALALLNVCYGYRVLPESLKKENRRSFSFARANPWGSFQHLRTYPMVPRLLLVVLLMQLALQTVPVTWPYFTAFRFDWTAREIGWSLGLYGLVGVMAQGLLLGRLVNRVGDARASCIGISMIALSQFGFALAPTVVLLIPFIVFSAMGYMSNGAMMGYISRQLPADEQGAAQGVIVGVNSLAAIVTPLLMPWLFSVFSSGALGVTISGAHFVVGAVLACAAFFLVFRLSRESGDRYARSGGQIG